MDPKLLAHVSHALGRPAPAAALGPFDSLNALSDAALGVLRGLDQPLRSLFLRALVPRTDGQFTQAFLVEVVEGDETAASWRRGGALGVTRELPELLRMSVDQILAPLRTPPEAEGWQVCVFSHPKVSPDSTTGAPVRSRPDLGYRSEIQRPLCRYAAELPTRAVGDVRVATRRWIATRVALAWGELPNVSAEHLAQRWATPAELSADARIALEALHLERAAIARPVPCPGQDGPDGWYRP